MAKFDGFSDGQLITMKKIYDAANLALEMCVKDFGTAQFRTRFRDWMGTAGGLNAIKAGEKNLEQSIRAMFMRARTLAFTVRYDSTMADNADMWGFTGADLSGPDVATLVDEYRSQSQSHTDSSGVVRVKQGSVVMRMGPAIWGMPFTSLQDQSQVETFLHELSHHAAGTIDDKNGGECYGLTGVKRLKGLGPARAVRNAENVGWFCVTYA
jgi:hypothetical protein